jgi:hypothetical protein
VVATLAGAAGAAFGRPTRPFVDDFAIAASNSSFASRIACSYSGSVRRMLGDMQSSWKVETERPEHD